MSRCVHHRVIEYFSTSGLYGAVFKVKIGVQVVVAELCEVLQRVYIVVPVATTTVFEQREFQGRRWRISGWPVERERRGKKETKREQDLAHEMSHQWLKKR